MKRLIEQTQRIPPGTSDEEVGDHLAAARVMSGCVIAYARKSTDGDGPPDSIVSLHSIEGDTVPRSGQRRALLTDAMLAELREES